MDTAAGLEGLSPWLTETVLGIIILSLCGSLAAALVMWSLKLLAMQALNAGRRIAPKAISVLLSRIVELVVKLVYRIGRETGAKGVGTDPRATAIFFAFQQTAAITWLVLSCTGALLFMILFFAVTEGLLTIGVYLLAVFSFLALIKSGKHLLAVWLPYWTLERFLDAVDSTMAAGESEPDSFSAD